MKVRVAFLLALLLAVPAAAQEQAMQRELIRRQQQQDAFALKLRQSQQLDKVDPGDLKRRQEIEARHLVERQQLENVSERQLREVKPDAQQDLRVYERIKAEEERRPLTVPAEQPN